MSANDDGISPVRILPSTLNSLRLRKLSTSKRLPLSILSDKLISVKLPRLTIVWGIVPVSPLPLRMSWDSMERDPMSSGIVDSILFESSRRTCNSDRKLNSIGKVPLRLFASTQM